MPAAMSRRWLGAAPILLVAVGCGSRLPPTAAVSGTLTLAGKPLAGAAVSFVNDAAPRFAIGTTDASGRYTLTTFAAGDGAVLGEHRVVVLPSPRAVGPIARDPTALPTEEDYKRLEELRKKPAVTASVPAKVYAAVDTTPLRAEVKRGGNTFDFDLKPE